MLPNVMGISASRAKGTRMPMSILHKAFMASNRLSRIVVSRLPTFQGLLQRFRSSPPDTLYLVLVPVNHTLTPHFVSAINYRSPWNENEFSFAQTADDSQRHRRQSKKDPSGIGLMALETSEVVRHVTSGVLAGAAALRTVILLHGALSIRERRCLTFL